MINNKIKCVMACLLSLFYLFSGPGQEKEPPPLPVQEVQTIFGLVPLKRPKVPIWAVLVFFWPLVLPKPRTPSPPGIEPWCRVSALNPESLNPFFGGGQFLGPKKFGTPRRKLRKTPQVSTRSDPRAPSPLLSNTRQRSGNVSLTQGGFQRHGVSTQLQFE